MITRQHRKSILRRLWMPTLTAGVLGYFAYHSFHGDYGIWAMDRLTADVERLTVQRDALRAERKEMERRVALVRPDSLDADTIDLQARTALNLMRHDEVVVRLGASQQLR